MRNSIESAYDQILMALPIGFDPNSIRLVRMKSHRTHKVYETVLFGFVGHEWHVLPSQNPVINIHFSINRPLQRVFGVIRFVLRRYRCVYVGCVYACVCVCAIPLEVYVS